MWPAGWLSSTSGLDVGHVVGESFKVAGNVLQDVNLQHPLRNQALCSYVAACQPATSPRIRPRLFMLQLVNLQHVSSQLWG